MAADLPPPPLPQLSLLIPREIAPVSTPPEAEAPAAKVTTGSIGEAAPDGTRDEARHAQPPTPTDRLGRRAEAVGLHPDLSHVVLARLSDRDFRNARRAIDKALAETPDGEVLDWPKRRIAGLAQFRVTFVDGAGRNCRRYVVAIAKSGWATTALPMERCGIKVPKARVATQVSKAKLQTKQ
ncbi:MAG: hypothetical protein ACK5JT_17085 [Hyphomicrobiaceae bacterium]